MKAYLRKDNFGNCMNIGNKLLNVQKTEYQNILTQLTVHRLLLQRRFLTA